MAKRVTCISIDSELHDRIKDNWNVSALAQMAIEIVLSTEFEDVATAMKVRHLEEEIDNLEGEARDARVRVERATQRRDELIKIRDRTIQDFERAKVTSRLSSLIKSLSRIAIVYEYDEAEVRENAQDVLDSIMILNPGFNLTKHLDRLKNIMDS